jgi:hypothetical protein
MSKFNNIRAAMLVDSAVFWLGTFSLFYGIGYGLVVVTEVSYSLMGLVFLKGFITGAAKAVKRIREEKKH